MFAASIISIVGAVAAAVLGLAMVYLQLRKTPLEPVQEDLDQATLQPRVQIEVVSKQPRIRSASSGGDRLEITVRALRQNPLMTDHGLAELLSLHAPADSRYWRLRAQRILDAEKKALPPPSPRWPPDKPVSQSGSEVRTRYTSPIKRASLDAEWKKKGRRSK